MSKAPIWVEKRALLHLHRESLAQFGGAGGIRDEGLLDSALARPINKHLHDDCADLVLLAAASGFAIAKNHPFLDGNKRAAFLAVGVVLAINQRRFVATPVEAVEAMLSLAAGTMDEPRFAEWIRTHSVAS